MQEERKQDPADSTRDDATSSKTLSDIQESENVTDNPGDGENSVPPAPDGAVNTDNGERNPNDDVGPI